MCWASRLNVDLIGRELPLHPWRFQSVNWVFLLSSALVPKITVSYFTYFVFSEVEAINQVSECEPDIVLANIVSHANPTACIVRLFGLTVDLTKSD